ncbi:MAG TPA: lysophospholipid acyltransferase family protein [Gemmatimonadaceae bacterium]|nr:lysophospholipid acyltransferase family protein [Gemmatimonadaceae bacterium]
MMRTAFVLAHLLVMTPICGGIVILASVLRVPARPGGIYDRMARIWARTLLRAGGVSVRVHHPERITSGRGPDAARIYMCNHVSWFDVFALAAQLPGFRFIAKTELSKLPIFGPAAGKAAAIYIDRDNRKAAFETYRTAVATVHTGVPVCVFPEGTRGYEYPLRPFKKGPFVFAIAAGVPIVPVVVHGTLRVQRKGTLRVQGGTVDLHFLEPVETAGMTYEDRDRLMRAVRGRMAEAMEREHGIQSPAVVERSA